jgi:hypothetical protein
LAAGATAAFPASVDAFDEQRQLRGAQHDAAVDQRGQMKRPFSSRLANRHMPSRSSRALAIVAALAPEQEQMPGIRVGVQDLLGKDAGRQVDVE